MRSRFEMEYLSELEKSLQDSLSPVKPRQVFVEDLKEKLSNAPQVALEDNPLTIVYLIFTFGLFFGVLIFWFFRRLIRSKQVNASTSCSSV